MNIIHWKLKTILLYFRTAWMILDFLSLRLQRLPFGEYLIVRLLKHLQKLTKWTHWKAKVLPYSFLAVRKRASLAGGLLSSRNWWEVCINFSCCHNRRWDKERISGNHEIAWWRWKSFYKELWGGVSFWCPTLLSGSLTIWDLLLEIILQRDRKRIRR